MNRRNTQVSLCVPSYIYHYEWRNHRHLVHAGRVGDCLPDDGAWCICAGNFPNGKNAFIALKQGDDGLYRMVGEFGAEPFGDCVGKIDGMDIQALLAGDGVRL